MQLSFCCNRLYLIEVAIIPSSILKSFELINNSHIIQGFGNNQYLVKSYSKPNDPSHFVCVRDNGFISCHNNCPKDNKEGYCGHIIGVALKYKLVEKYASALSKCQERTVTQLASQNINPSHVGRKRPQRIRNSVKGSPEKRFRKNRSNSTEHSERVVSDQNPSNVTFSGRAASPLSLSISQNQLHGRTFLQEVLNPLPTMFHIFGQPVASQRYFNGPLKDIKNEFVITLLSLCDKRVSICYGCTHELKYQVAIPAPPFDLVVLTKMRRDYYPDGKKCQPAPSNVYFHAVYNNPFFTPFECIQRKLITFNVNRLQFHSHA